MRGREAQQAGSETTKTVGRLGTMENGNEMGGDKMGEAEKGASKITNVANPPGRILHVCTHARPHAHMQ
ncbi:unnamed protein product [Periconia digitata]|uniref:Uncharacterized protein n=1 Tax=Periconia digitata TaxID=1303443 RepID=A0A9W4U5C8_9PLEO|nr:unnamed protein product [Periconia digitata]